MAPYVTVYNNLIKTLTESAGLKLDKDLYVYTYDWRQNLDKQAENLRNYIDNLLSGKPVGTKVILLGHSLGGMTARSYLTKYTDHKAWKVITVGTPHQGTVLAYPIWEKGEFWVDDRNMKIAVNQVVEHCRLVMLTGGKFLTRRETVQKTVPVINNLLPVFNYLKNGNTEKPTDKLLNQNDWLNHHLQIPNLADLKFQTLSGNENPTLRFLKVVPANKIEAKLGDWADGKPVARETINSGDGTVLQLSGQIPTVINNVINQDHSGLISSSEGIKKILELLDLPEKITVTLVAPEEITSTKSLTLSTSLLADLNLIDPKNRKFTGKENILALANPEIGVYRLKVLPKDTGSSFIHAQILDNNNNDKFVSLEAKLAKNKLAEFFIVYNPNSGLKIIKI